MATLTKGAGKRSLLRKTGERTVRMERVFRAVREQVWKAFTDPALIRQWWARGNPLDVEKMEVLTGGHWRFVEHSREGTDGFEGRFRTVKPPALLEQTFEWDGAPGHVAVSTATFTPLGKERTRVVTDLLFLTAQDRNAMVGAGMEQGMLQSYAALDRLLANAPIVEPADAGIAAASLNMVQEGGAEADARS